METADGDEKRYGDNQRWQAVTGNSKVGEEEKDDHRKRLKEELTVDSRSGELMEISLSSCEGLIPETDERLTLNGIQTAIGVDELESRTEVDGKMPTSVGNSFQRNAETGHPSPLSFGDKDGSSSSSSPCPSLSALFSTLSLSSSSPQLSAGDLDAVLLEGRLRLDVYQGGAALMPALWESVPDRMRQARYIQLGSEDEEALQQALDILPHLTQLRSLAIRGHRFYDAQGEPLPGLLTTLPPSVTSLLVHLDLSFNRLSSLPACLLSLSHLSELILCNNQLSSLPGDLGGLVSLRHLNLLGNKLQTLPSGVGLLLALQELNVSFNQLESLPEELGLLQHLHMLELSFNKLRELPNSLGSLHSLRVLAINSNELRSVPGFVNSLPELTKLDVQNNPLGRPPTPPPLPLVPTGCAKHWF